MKHTILTAVALSLLFLGCRSPIPGWLNVPERSTQDGIQVDIDGVVGMASWFSKLAGTATNVSDTPVTSVSISFEAIDSHGAQIGTARAEHGPLAPGEKWAFQAEFPREIKENTVVSSPRIKVTR